MLSVIFFISEKMNLKICFRTFVVDMRIKLGEIHGAEVEIGKCNLSLEDLHCLCLIDKHPIFFKRDINGIDEIDHALQEAIIKLKGYLYPAVHNKNSYTCTVHNKNSCPLHGDYAQKRFL